MNEKFVSMEANLESRLNRQSSDFNLKVEQMTKKLGTIVISSISALAVLIKYLL